MEKTHVLLKCSFDYADEFNCESLALMSKIEWEQYQEDLKIGFTKLLEALTTQTRPPNTPDWKWRNMCRSEIEVGFGTNEELRFSDAEDVLRQIDVTEITAAEEEVLHRLIGKSYGTADSTIWRVWQQLDDRSFIPKRS